MIIYLDFDGTVVEHQYPIIGRYNKGSLELVRKLQDAGHEIVLNTYRIEIKDNSFEESMSYLNDSKIIHPITKYTDVKIHPLDWNLDAAIELGELFIDDIAKGIPLIPAVYSNTKMVDWDTIENELKINKCC